MVQRKVRSEKLLARRVTHLPEKRPLQILIFLARDLATFLGAQSQSSQPLSVFTRASNLDARKEIHSGRLDRRARSISRIRSACIEVQRSSCVIMITTAQGTFGVLLVPKKCPALVNIKTVVSVRQVASGGGATDVGPNITSSNSVRDDIGGWSGSNESRSRGAFSSVGLGSGPRSQSSYRDGYHIMISLNAHGASSIYGASDVVQPASFYLLPCIKS